MDFTAFVFRGVSPHRAPLEHVAIGIRHQIAVHGERVAGEVRVDGDAGLVGAGREREEAGGGDGHAADAEGVEHVAVLVGAERGRARGALHRHAAQPVGTVQLPAVEGRLHRGLALIHLHEVGVVRDEARQSVGQRHVLRLHHEGVRLQGFHRLDKSQGILCRLFGPSFRPFASPSLALLRLAFLARLRLGREGEG